MTTLSAYNQVVGNTARWQSLTAKTPDVAIATAYYRANIGNVKTADDLIGNARLLNYAIKAFGLDDLAAAKGLIRKVLAGGVDDPSSLANTLHNPRLLAFAKTFDFAGGDAVTSSKAATDDVVAAFVQQRLEATQGANNKGVQLALYFQRNASRITGVYDILADKNLLKVVQTALGISPMTSAQNIDVQASNLKKQVTISDFADPKKLNAFIARFAAQYDVQNASTSAASSGVGLSVDLLASLQTLRTRV